VPIAGSLGATAMVGEPTVLKAEVTAMNGVFENTIKIFLKILFFFCFYILILKKIN